ncbi:rod shape-determining protein MreD [cf. Phormidesmis sp. LEGE 11477]|uniref:rod shape-determining protein MreD n=1 Tax=cf. Phormidesmis sp. LEGE 11477 TaxID=1828680 RepID=UPI001882E220|nr:rod shape-determining protein MreD [cf. Phormidesmis sp. LEGE 11477]MBE9062688.1 rod shape-determining protein MreD [cf. Phormidesmis sp. LEGE 11477]
MNFYRSRRSARRPTKRFKSHRPIWNWLFTVGSVLVCLLLLPTRLPGMDILGVGPNWLLVWVVVWSIRRTQFDGAIVGIVLGLLQDGLTGNFPTHVPGLMLAGIITARLHRRRFVQVDLISVAIIVFGLAIATESVMALQLAGQYLLGEDALYSSLSSIWQYYQRVALSSAILSSLWAPALYYPLQQWWNRYETK